MKGFLFEGLVCVPIWIVTLILIDAFEASRLVSMAVGAIVGCPMAIWIYRRDAATMSGAET